MSDYIAALPMYDWHERRADVDAEWEEIGGRMRAAGIEAPVKVVRRNADMPPVPGGVYDERGQPIAPDPVTLPPDELDFHALWTHPNLLFAQACWGPLDLGLARHVRLVGQPDYSAVEGGKGEFYSSAIVMRATPGEQHVSAPDDGAATIPLERMRGRRFAFNEPDSMSGILALTRDLEAVGESLGLFSDRIVSGGHRNSIIAVASGEADVATVDCMSWALAQRYEPAARKLAVVGWTALRKGLPYICSRHLPEQIFQSIRGLMAAELRSGTEVVGRARTSALE
jgi:ABC-type phosphate/phosphonate transport system substrate-binding protein